MIDILILLLGMFIGSTVSITFLCILQANNIDEINDNKLLNNTTK